MERLHFERGNASNHTTTVAIGKIVNVNIKWVHSVSNTTRDIVLIMVFGELPKYKEQ